jgi:hypothetical protein
MTTEKDSPRGRFVRRHPRKLEGRFVNIPAYQEEIDRQSAKSNPIPDRQLKLPLPTPETRDEGKITECNAKSRRAK